MCTRALIENDSMDFHSIPYLIGLGKRFTQKILGYELNFGSHRYIPYIKHK